MEIIRNCRCCGKPRPEEEYLLKLEFCPYCGQPNPYLPYKICASEWERYQNIYSVKLSGFGFILGALAGGIWGIIAGFQAHGVGGAILYAILAAAGGGFGGFVVGKIALPVLFWGTIFGGIGWIFYLLWDLGK